MQFSVKLMGFGNGVGIILPPEALERLKSGKGDSLWLVETPVGYQLTAHDPAVVGQMVIAQDIMHEMREALQEMSK